MPALLNADALCARLPHGSPMCLLHRVVTWSPEEIHCTALSHRDPDHPLRVAGGLPSVSGVEYAAQAMAIHGGLCAGEAAPRKGVLASVRNLQLHGDWLHDKGEALDIFARKLRSGSGGGVYDFRVSGGDGLTLLSGRVTVIYLDGMP